MIFRFGRKQLSDVVKIQQFLEKENIEFELLLDQIDVQVGAAGIQTTSGPTEVAAPNPAPVKAEVNPGWEPAKHNGNICRDVQCGDAHHYFATVE